MAPLLHVEDRLHLADRLHLTYCLRLTYLLRLVDLLCLVDLLHLCRIKTLLFRALPIHWLLLESDAAQIVELQIC